jgi:hypothetical protein
MNSYLYFGTAQRCRGVHDGGTDIPADVEHDAPFLAGAQNMTVFHDYDGTDTGVTEGLE